MVDAPVSGSIITLQQGKLSVMVGGTNAPRSTSVKPILDDVGPKVTHVGDNGLALVMKIATNLSLAVQMLAFSEGVLLAEKSGIARATAVDVLTHSVIASPMVVYRGPFVLKMPDEAWFNVNMMQKDMLLAMELGRQVDVPLPTTAVDERISDRRPRDGPRRRGLRDDLQGAREHGGRERPGRVGRPFQGRASVADAERARSSRARSPSRFPSTRARLRSSRPPSAE